MPVVAAARIRIGADSRRMLDPALEIPAAHAQAGEDRQNRADDDPTIHAAPVGQAYLVKPFDDKPLLDRIARVGEPSPCQQDRDENAHSAAAAGNLGAIGPLQIIRTRAPNPANLAEMETSSRVIAVLQKSLMLDPERFTPTALLVDDLGVSSLDRFELLMDLEDEFKIEMDETELVTVRTVGDLTAYIKTRMAA